MINIRAKLLKESPRVRGNDVITTCLISEKLILKENLGAKPQ